MKENIYYKLVLENYPKKWEITKIKDNVEETFFKVYINIAIKFGNFKELAQGGCVTKI